MGVKQSNMFKYVLQNGHRPHCAYFMKKFVFTKNLYSRNCFYRQKGALKVKLENFSSSDTKVKNINILVAGQVGAGKSSFINSINSAFQGRIVARAMVNSSEGDSHSFTQKVGILFYKKKKKCNPSFLAIVIT